ncbi:MAG: phosphatase PAP2 family protein [Planctomycetota bacterium]|jgi:hypothetical protein
MRHFATLGTAVICVILLGGCSHSSQDDFRSALNNYELSRCDQQIAASRSVPRTFGSARSGVGGNPGTWLAVGVLLAQNDPEPVNQEQANQQASFVPWRERYGPAHPGDVWRSFGRDVLELPATIWDDTVATFTDPWALTGLAGAVAAGAVLDAANTNGCVADHFRKNRSQLNTFWDNVGDVGGNPGLHFAVAGAMYFNALYRNDDKNYEVSKTLINALAVNGIVTMALKGIAHSDSPNGDPLGWPSGHTSSTFCFATVMHEAYGPWVGVPLFAFAAFVGYERIDARNHDFNDVISGALIGIAIGHVVYQNHRPKIFGMDVIPYVDPQRGAVGITLTKQF